MCGESQGVCEAFKEARKGNEKTGKGDGDMKKQERSYGCRSIGQHYANYQVDFMRSDGKVWLPYAGSANMDLSEDGWKMMLREFDMICKEHKDCKFRLIHRSYKRDERKPRWLAPWMNFAFQIA